MPYFYLNNKKILYKEGQTILEKAKEEGIEIPHLCHNPEFKSKATCRVCVVEIVGQLKLVTACSTKIKSGMRVKTDSSKVKRVRNLNLQLVFASHKEECSDCLLLYNCPLLQYAKKYKLSLARFKDRKNQRKKYNFNQAVEVDASQCIDCGLCVEVCQMGQKIDCLEFKNKGVNQELRPKKKNQCIYCGQCALHCPVFAAQERQNWPAVSKLLDNKQKNKDKILIAQIAPSIRASLSEAFGLKSGKFSIDLISAALYQLGFDYVFDVNFGADITTLVEAQELLERLADKKAKLPMFTSCCPAWVAYVEKIRPDLIPYLTSSRSPQMHNAALIKTYFAKENNINPKKIELISIMPCTAKKFERNRKEFKGLVEHVLTVRELAFLLKKSNINPLKLKARKTKNIMSDFSGAAAIFGASGGVMESALRSANYSLKSKTRIDFKSVRGVKGLREAEVKVGKSNLKVAIVSGIGNIDYVLANLDKYHYIEVMACPGGCIGGGGQIIPTNLKIIQERAQSLYNIDTKHKLRRANENLLAKQAIDNKLDHKLLHTKYYKRK